MNSLSQVIPAKGISMEKSTVRKWPRQSREKWEEKGNGSGEVEEKGLLQMDAVDRRQGKLKIQKNIPWQISNQEV